MIRFGFVAIGQIKSYKEDVYQKCSYLNYTTVCAVVIKGTAHYNIMKNRFNLRQAIIAILDTNYHLI